MQTSCYTCRRRHVECQMTKPPCRKCTAAGLECTQTRPLRWIQGVRFRSTSRRSGTETASRKSDAVAVCVPVMAGRDMLQEQVTTWRRSGLTIREENAALINGSIGTVAYRRQQQPIARLGDPALSSLNSTARYYVDYYNRRVCSLFVLYDSVRNPLRSVIGAAFESPLLLNSIIALSARHMANARLSFSQCESVLSSTSLPSPDHTVLLFKNKTLKGLSEAVNDTHLCMLDTTVTSALFLILLNFLEAESNDWSIHLHGIKRLISQIEIAIDRKGVLSRDVRPSITGILDFIIRQIHVIEAISTVYTNQQTPRSLCDPQPVSAKLLQESLESSYLGCPVYILDAIGVFSTCRDLLLSLESKNEMALKASIQRALSVLTSTENFDCYGWAATLPQMSSTPAHVKELSSLAETYKIGAQLFGRRVIDALVVETTIQHDLVRRLLCLIRELTGNEKLFKCTLWPMIIAGLESQQETQKDFLIGCLRMLWLETRCLDAVHAGIILNKWWQSDKWKRSAPSQWIFEIGRLVDGRLPL